jgi:predicted amidophosphoribosyltransferase
MLPGPLRAVTGVLDSLLDGRDCSGCGRELADREWHLCATCAEKIAGQASQVRRPTSGLPWIVAAQPYADPVRALVIAWKERGRAALAEPIAQLMLSALQEAYRPAGDLGSADLGTADLGTADLGTADLGTADPRYGGLVLVPVPARTSARRARGDDIVLDLARRAGMLLPQSQGRVKVIPALRHTRHSRDQTTVSGHQRSANVSGSMAVSARQAQALRVHVDAGLSVAVVDDVVTSGATVREAVRALHAGGIPVSFVVAVAAVQWGNPLRSQVGMAQPSSPRLIRTSVE